MSSSLTTDQWLARVGRELERGLAEFADRNVIGSPDHNAQRKKVSMDVALTGTGFTYKGLRLDPAEVLVHKHDTTGFHWFPDLNMSAPEQQMELQRKLALAPPEPPNAGRVTPEDTRFMCIAVDLAKEDPAFPFGCIVVSEDGEMRVQSYGTGSDEDCTAHSEIKAIRRMQRRWPGELTGCTVYSTHEPCAMCAGALVHARPDRVVFGTRRADVPSWFRPRQIAAIEILGDCSRPITVVGGVMKHECLDLFNTVEARRDVAKDGA